MGIGGATGGCAVSAGALASVGAGGADGGSRPAHAAISTVKAAAASFLIWRFLFSTVGIETFAELDMTWLLLEAGVALALLILIVWWTLPRKPRDDKDAEE